MGKLQENLSLRRSLTVLKEKLSVSYYYYHYSEAYRSLKAQSREKHQQEKTLKLRLLVLEDIIHEGFQISVRCPRTPRSFLLSLKPFALTSGSEPGAVRVQALHSVCVRTKTWRCRVLGAATQLMAPTTETNIPISSIAAHKVVTRMRKFQTSKSRIALGRWEIR